MALFGNKRSDDFPIGLPGLMGGYGGGTFNPDGSAATPTISTPSGNDLGAMPAGLTLGATTPQPKKGGGLFGSNSALWKVMGAVGDAMSMSNGLPATFTPAMLAQRQHQQTMAEKEADRQAQYQDWVRQQEYTAAHPHPVNNDTVNDYTFISQQLGHDAADQYLRNLGDPIVTVQLPGNRVYSGPRSGMAAALAGGAGAAPATISAEDWNKGTPVGGGVGNGASNFRP